tara:strand:+ start:1230 stop:2162 length:933 start_codon:yes stop_codon:yes gene_type:complete
MAKSSLQFLEKRNVDLYDSDSYAIRTLEKHDCGKVVVLTNARGHTLTLPPAATVGEGWNVRFVVGAVHSDRSVRDLTTIAAQGSETVTLTARKVGGTLAGGAASANADAMDTAGINLRAAEGQDELTKEDFTIVVPVAAGGTGTTFRFLLKDGDADLTADNSAAGQFEISTENLTDAGVAGQIIAIINGAAVAAGVRVPASGEGSTNAVGIQGLTASPGTNETTEIDLAASQLGAAGDGITVAYHHGDHTVSTADIIGANNSITLAAGADRTGVSLDTRTIQITEGATAGDQIELVVVNGQWQATSLRAE